MREGGRGGRGGGGDEKYVVVQDITNVLGDLRIVHRFA